ncbi:hypothetical protein ACS0TY_005443 [Phlomoides rotata]
MVQTPFTWRYGGRQVLLSGSFNGWSVRIPMVLMEGSQTVFQKIVDLPPGCYQYKFFVDGTWRVDQQQICDVDETGIINNIVLVSGIEISFFRQLLSIHLLSSTTYELIPISGKVIALDIETEVEQAFHVMYNSGLTSMPLWDDNSGQMAGMLTASDFILILLQAGPDESLADVASRILRNNISAVPILDSENGACPRLLHIACLAGVLKNICSHFKHHLGYQTLLQRPVGYLPIGTWAVDVRGASARPLLTLHPNVTLTSALALLLEAQISSIPIVDNGGNFMNMYSRSDITSFARDNICTNIQLNQITLSQALEFTSERGESRYKTCTRFDSLYHVMELLSEPEVRRVIVVEASTRRVEGIITLRDVFCLVLLSTN